MNVGARRDTDSGLYFSWGNTIGQESSSGYNFDTLNYAESQGSELESNVDLAHDAARLTLGGSWRMPTTAEWEELINNTTQRWTTKEGVQGVLFQSTVNGQSIFVPNMGYWQNSRIYSVGRLGRYWTADWNSEEYAYVAVASEGSYTPRNRSLRYIGCTIRAVRDD